MRATVDDLAADAQVRHRGVSPEGRSAMARTVLDEERLTRLVRGFPPVERRAFWIGVLLRDGAITAEEALRARSGPPPAPKPQPVVMVARVCRKCGAGFEERRHRGRPRTLCDGCRGHG